MDVKDITAWATVSGLFTGGIIYLWKKIIKPIIKGVRQYFDIVENSGKIEYNTLRINSIIHLSNTAIFEADSTGGFVRANSALIEIFGAYNESELLGLGFLNFILITERAQFRNEWLDGLLRDKETNKVFTIQNKKTKETITVNLIALMNKDENGKLINVMGNINVIK